MPLHTLGFLIFALVVAFAVISWAAGIYNGLISLRNQVNRAWSNIDVILKQRHDLIPQLVSICEQFTEYERGTFDHLVEARKMYGAAQTRQEQMTADQKTTAALRGLFAIGEAYPVLKSSDQFLQIQTSIAGLESQLADRRELYNESVTNFNTRILQIPDVFFARMLEYQNLELYKVDSGDKVMPLLKMKMPA